MSRKGSMHPVRDASPEWVPMLGREVEAKIVEMAKDGVQPAQIGLILRDTYGVPNVHELTGKKLGAIIADAGAAPGVPQELTNLINRAINLLEHLKSNRKDLHNTRGLELIEARIRKLAKYYKSRGQLEASWKYTRGGARLLVD
ncbi:MAG: 30S ribosomal protein S15 [Thermoplasmatota archaeon]